MLANRRKPPPLTTFYLLIAFPFFRNAKAFYTTRVTSLVYPRLPLPHYFTQITTSVHSPFRTTGNIMTLLSTTPTSDHFAAVGQEDDEVCVRILCLHGKGGNGPKFVNTTLKPLRSLVEQRAAAITNNPAKKDDSQRVSFQWGELTAPYEILSGEDAGGYMWWTMPNGVRSYNAEEYEGFDKSEALVMDALFSTDSTTSNFDIILGHSQGAILTAALISKQERLRNMELGPRGYLLNGVAWPNPFGETLLSLAQEISATEPLPKIAFVMGKADTINPIKSAQQVYDSYLAARFDVSIVHHEGGHSVPFGKDDDSIRALNEVVDWIFDIAREKAAKLKTGA